MERTYMHRSVLRLAALFAAATLTACASMLDDETAGTRPDPAGGSMFRTYAAIGTSISAGIQSGGINDSTQRESFVYQLALTMGLTPGQDWFYPSLAMPGCPAPLINPLAGTRIGGVSATACGRRVAASARPYESNVGIPSLRIAQALDLSVTTFPTDTLKLAQFITGAIAPVTMVQRQGATFVTLEVGANDVLGAATRGDTTLLTPLASFQSSLTAIADSLDAMNPTPGVAVMTVPDVTLIPHLTRGLMFYCLKNGCAPLGIPATPPFSNATFAPAANCAPSAFGPGGVGDSSYVAFPTTGGIAGVLNAGGAVTLDCATGAVLVNVGAGFVVPTQFSVLILTPPELLVLKTRLNAFNAAITALATARSSNWVAVDANAILAANAASIPAFPSLSTPTAVFGTLFSQDGVHPTRAGHRLLANGFIAAINTKFGTSLTPIP